MLCWGGGHVATQLAALERLREFHICIVPIVFPARHGEAELSVVIFLFLSTTQIKTRSLIHKLSGLVHVISRPLKAHFWLL